MNSSLFFITLSIFALLYLCIGLWASRSVKTLKNYFLANRNLTIMQLTFALIASQLGSGMLLGTAYKAYFIGPWGLLYTIGMSLGFFIFGFGLAAKMRTLNISTTAELLKTHYQSESLQKIASLLSIISLSGILIAQIVASKTLFLSLGVDNGFIFYACWGCVICYTMLGGLQALVMVDIAQVSSIIIIFSAALIHLLYTSNISLSVEKINLTYNASYNPFTLLSTLLIPTLFCLIEQDVAQKFFAAKNRFVASVSALLAGLFLILFSCIPLIMGMIPKIYDIAVAQNTNPMIITLIKYSNEYILIIAVCAIIAAITSTANSLMCAISSNVLQDFKIVQQEQKNALVWTKLIAAIIGINAVIGSYFIQGDIISLLESSYRISTITLFVPTIAACFTRKQSFWVAANSMLGGLLGYFISHIFCSTMFAKDLFGLASSFAGYIASKTYLDLKKS